MKKFEIKPNTRVRFFFAFLLIFLFSCTTHKDDTSTSLKSLVGLWKSEGNLVFYEHWIQLPDSSLVGKGFSINGTDTLFSESLRIAYQNDTLYYYATVYRQNKGGEIPFRLVKSEKSGWVFENPSHDYPNRIIYKIQNDSVLFARTENIRGNKPIEFRFKKVK